ncbi:MAG: hypothetical protein LBT00_12595 [Spirochaetaceae bacterium]|nr:hypothetical protein [Spirochaetaceae bacterium]
MRGAWHGRHCEPAATQLPLVKQSRRDGVRPFQSWSFGKAGAARPKLQKQGAALRPRRSQRRAGIVIANPQGEAIQRGHNALDCRAPLAMTAGIVIARRVA